MPEIHSVTSTRQKQPRSASGTRRRSRGVGRRTGATRAAILHTAAKIYVTQGYKGTTIRSIATAQGLLPGSIYHHFPSKEALIIEIYEEAINHIIRNVTAAIGREKTPWARLEAACAAHLDTLINGRPHVGVLAKDIPASPAKLVKVLIGLREQYEAVFRTLVDDLKLGNAMESRLFRLQLLGSLNRITYWYREGGGLTPAEIAHGFIANLRRSR